MAGRIGHQQLPAYSQPVSRQSKVALKDRFKKIPAGTSFDIDDD